MTTRTATPAQPTRTDDDRRLPDPPRIYDMAQLRQQTHVIGALDGYFRERRYIVIDGEFYVQLRLQTGRDAPERLVPDILIGLDVDPKVVNRRNGWVIEETGKPPDVVFEIASDSTARRDYRDKPEVYARFGVPEMWMFDETGGRRYGAALIGLRLVEGRYVEIPIEELSGGVRRGWSEVMQLYVCWVDEKMRFFDPVTEAYLPDATEALVQRDAAEAAREAAEARAREAEAEIARLRRLLQTRAE